MTGPELAAAFGGTLIGAALGVLMMVWHWWRAERAAPDVAGPSRWWRFRAWLRRGLALPRLRDEQFYVVVAQARSLRASLDDAHREVSRLTGEKHARDQVIHEAIGVLERLHRQEAGK